MLHSSDVTYENSSLDPLPRDVHHGMIAMGTIGLVSSISTLALLIFITYRMIRWRRYYEHPIATNQIFVLIYNLLLADLQQALSFLLAFYWISENKLVGPSPVCFAQGWLIQIGDLSSGIWVLAIAVHTFVGLVVQRTIPFGIFVGLVLLVWIFCLVLTVVGPIQEQVNFFVPAGLWVNFHSQLLNQLNKLTYCKCWIGEKHESDRLTLHYLWIFVSQLGSLVIYIAIFFYLRTRIAESITTQQSLSQDTPVTSVEPGYTKPPTIGTTTTIVSHPISDPFAVSRQKILRTARYMIVYPIAYILLTLPLAAGRVASMTGRKPPLMYYTVAGAMMACCGFVDVALYIYTRKALVRSNVGHRRRLTTSQNHSLSQYPSVGQQRRDAWHTSWHEDDSIAASLREGASQEDIDMHVDHKLKIENGAIVVQQTITRREEGDEETVGEGRFARSESLKSLVGKGEGGTGGKSWLA
jgi:hypothetical protein